jgi:hypothetical protein
MIMSPVLVIGIFLCGMFNLKANCASSVNEPPKERETEKLQEQEETGDSEVFKPTHEWQNIKAGKSAVIIT